MVDTINQFTIRVYGLVINDAHELLVTDELINGLFMTKFPGGGLEFGEGLLDCLKREFREECSSDIEVIDHYYTTDFYQESAFHKSTQLISVYYKVRLLTIPEIACVTVPFEGLNGTENPQVFRWIPLKTLNIEDVTWPVDRVVVSMLLQDSKLK